MMAEKHLFSGLTDQESLLQIQPAFATRDRWEALALKEGLFYEVLELSAPPALNDAELYDACKDWYLADGRVTSVHGAFINIDPGSGDKKMRELSRERCAESCRLAMALGAGNVVFHSSCFPFLRGGYLDSWAGSCAGFYDELADAFPLNIFIENSPDVDPEPLRELMKRVYSRRIGVCLDIGHAGYSRSPLEEWFGELHEWIGYLHLSDNDGRFDDHLPLGQGTVDWELADRLWRELGVPTPMTIETKNVQAAAESVAFLKERRLFGTDGGDHE